MSWTTCDLGHRHWGRHGAAGLLLVEHGRVLLQLRSLRVHRGGTWAFPAGAIERGETPVEAALRETREETGIDTSLVRVGEAFTDDCGGWSFTTVLATVDAPVDPQRGWEADHHEWVAVADVADRDLLPAFARAWGARLARAVEEIAEPPGGEQ